MICPAVLRREARAQGKTLQAHWAHLVVHGALHLAGFDHEDESDARRMERREIAVLRALGFDNPYRRAPMSDDKSPTQKILRRIRKFTAPKDRAQLRELLRNAGHAGLLDADALSMVEGVLDVSDLQVRDIMVPHNQMISVQRRRSAAAGAVGRHRFRALALSRAGAGWRQDHRASCWPRTCCGCSR